MNDDSDFREPPSVNLNMRAFQIKDLFAPTTLIIISAVLIGLLLALIRWASPVLTPILLAMYIAALCLPIYHWMLKRGLPKNLALLMMIVVVVAGIGIIGLLLLASANRLSSGLSEYLPGLSTQLQAIQGALAAIELGSLGEWLSGSRVSSFVAAFLASTASFLGNLLFSLVLVAFFLVESDRFFDLATTKLQGVPLFSQLPAVAQTAVTYFGIRTRLNLITGVIFGFVLLILGVDYALLWAALAFILSYIPYVGLLTAMIPPTILALAQYGLVRAILVIAAAIIINLTIENLLEPAYTGHKLKLSPTVVFISFFVWAWLLGPVGALLSMPITVMIMLVLEEDESTQWAARILGNTRE